MYFLLAIPFRSYAQPVIVMLAIPFGIVGAVLGHVIMGYNLSLLSMMGVVAEVRSPRTVDAREPARHRDRATSTSSPAS